MASSSSQGSSRAPLHYFPTPALDHAFAGIVAGAVATVCMNPLDLVKVQFQVDTSTKRTKISGGNGSGSSSGGSSDSSSRWRKLARKATGGDVLRDMTQALREIVRRDGYTGLYRGLSPNVVGNSASWGLYFLWYTMIKEYMASPSASSKLYYVPNGSSNRKLSAGEHLFAASASGAVTALMTNPIWVVKTRMFTTSQSGQSIIPFMSQPRSPNAATATTVGSTASTQSILGSTRTSPIPHATSTAATATKADSTNYRGLLQGLSHIWRHEGWTGMYKGAGLALVGVSNGAIQFVCYEELKRWRMGVARRRQAGNADDQVLTSSSNSKSSNEEENAVQLDNREYIIMSGLSKLAAICLTYPYQVVRSRIQNHATAHIYPDIPTCLRLTWQKEGARGFYKGMAANAIRIIPGTCVTFVVYENCSWTLRGLAERKLAQSSGSGSIGDTTNE